MSSPFQRAVIQRDQAFQRTDTVLAALRAKARAFLATAASRVVLVVDDERALASGFARILRGSFRDLNVVTCHTVAEAEAWLGQNLPGVAILDMHLTDGVGWDLAARLPRSVKVILMSGALPPGLLAQMGRQTSAVSTLEKPIDADTLVRVVREALGEPEDDDPSEGGPVHIA